MAEKKDTPPAEAPKAASTVQVEANGPEVTPPTPLAAVSEASLVGDEAIAAADSIQVVPVVVAETVPAQVTGAPAVPVTTVQVHEVHVATNEVITDTSDPRAVQIPDAGRGSLDLPIHALAGPTVEEVFSREAS